MKSNLPQKRNNPFALIQSAPSKWRGLVVGSKGFLEFETVLDGVRAGFINLFQTYYLKGFQTIREIFRSDRIFPVYGDAGKGDLYIKLVSEFTGFDPDKKLSVRDMLAVGRAIERVEEGRQWVGDITFREGFQMALNYLKL